MKHRYEVEIAGRSLIMETGELAQQAGGAVTVRYGDTMLIAAATASTPRRGIDFFPLSIEFEERLYAAGRIPGSFFRREGRPTTSAILSARLTDRPLRPLFPKGYMDDTQIVITILSVDMENPPDTLGTIAASAALTISDIPFNGPVASVRIGSVDGELILQPTFEQLENSSLNLIVSGTADALMMVEAEASEVSESLLVDALVLGQEAITKIVALQEEMRADVGKAKRAYTRKTVDADVRTRVDAAVGEELQRVLSAAAGLTKEERDTQRNALKAQMLEGVEEGDDDAVADAFEDVEREIVRRAILERGERPDGRTPTDVRPLSASVGLIPRTHGSGLFQRGETQVLSLTTLGGAGMAQRLDDLTPESTKRFMHHYNFPPFSVGETGRIGGAGRREIGHGMLGERAMSCILPPFDDFPYTIRIVSEVLSSNGSTSMASVCASVLSLMDAGVPIRTPIAGAAMGLIKGEGADEYTVLTDIAGMEDHLGDMDLKVAGSRDGVTALQMDIKVRGISHAIIARALEQAREARLEILAVMLECLAEPREEVSPFAPRTYRVDVPTDKIGAIIGPGGKTIRAMEASTGASIDIEDNGAVFVSAVDADAAQKAVDQILALTKEVEPGETYTGKVTRIMNFGAFVEILPGKDALVHISELANYRVPSVEDVVKLGDEVTVIVTEIDNMGRVNASRRALLKDGDGAGRDDGARDGGGPRADRGDRRSRGGDRADRGSRDRDRDRPRDADRDADRNDRPRDADRDADRNDRPRDADRDADRNDRPRDADRDADRNDRPRDADRDADRNDRPRDADRDADRNDRPRDADRDADRNDRPRDADRDADRNDRPRDADRDADRNDRPRDADRDADRNDRPRDADRDADRNDRPRDADRDADRNDRPRDADRDADRNDRPRDADRDRPRDADGDRGPDQDRERSSERRDRASDSDSNGDGGQGRPRRRRRRRRTGSSTGGAGGTGSAQGGGDSNERVERQPDSNVGSRSIARSILSRAGLRRSSSEGPAGPPPPPRSDFGAGR